MAFEPKTWACGDTITAQELNRIEQGIAEAGQGGGDAGYECTETEKTIFDSSLTTSSMGSFSGTTFTPSQPIDGESIVVTLDGSKYELPKAELSFGSGYGEFDASSNPVFTNYPCAIGVDSSQTYFFTASSGTYQVGISALTKTAIVTPCFKIAVESLAPIFKVNISSFAMEYSADKTFEEVKEAIRNGMPVVAVEGTSVYYYSADDISTSPESIGFFSLVLEHDSSDNIIRVSVLGLRYLSNGEIKKSVRVIYQN